MADDTEARVRKLIAEHLDKPSFEWTDALADLGADSLDMVEIAMKLDEEFGVTVDDDAVFAWRTAGDVFRSVMVVADA